MWTDNVAERVLCAANTDVEYQQLLKECLQAEETYKSIVAMLTEEQCVQIERYIALCEELDYRFSQLAYCIGKSEKGMACHAVCLLEESCCKN